MDFFLIHVLNLFFPFVKILFQSSWNVLHFYWLFYAQFCVIIFISSCLCCVSPFLSHHVRLYLRFYSFIYLFMSMLHFTIFVMLYLCCVFTVFVVLQVSRHPLLVVNQSFIFPVSGCRLTMAFFNVHWSICPCMIQLKITCVESVVHSVSYHCYL